MKPEPWCWVAGIGSLVEARAALAGRQFALVSGLLLMAPMDEPGGLSHLDGEGRADWNDRLERASAVAQSVYGENEYLLTTTGGGDLVATIDWTGLPARVAACLGRERAIEFLDWRGAGWESGRYLAQEEYVEWRSIHDEAGDLCRVELTTELAAYWRSLAAYEPAQTLELVAEFAGEARVPPEAVFGQLDPFGAEPVEREEAFAQTMLPPLVGASSSPEPSPYNNGQKAVCCMIQPSNILFAAVKLLWAAARPRVVDDESRRPRPMNAAEVIPLIPGAATQGRASDPVLVERLGRLAYEGRQVGLDDPPGIYIQDVEHARLRLPNGEAVPRNWFSFQRGLGPNETPDCRARFQRVVFEVPTNERLTISDLTDSATEAPVRFGTQVAELVQLAAFIQVSQPGEMEREFVPQKPGSGSLDCDAISAAYEQFSSG